MVSPSLHRIVAVHRLAAVDPKTLLPAFEDQALTYLQEVPEGDMKWLLALPDERPFRSTTPEEKEAERREYKVRSNLMKAILSSVGYELTITGGPLFQAILQAYSLPRALGSKVEAANRFFSKTRRPSLSRDSKTLVADYTKLREMVRGFLELAKTAIRSGKAHDEGDTKIKAGPFTLINTGGFSSEKMGDIKTLTVKASQLLQQKNLSKVCYGDIQVTKTLTKASTIAFYMIPTDEMFVRANAPKSEDTLETILHELGHRMEHKFLKHKKDDIKQMYATIARKPVAPPPKKDIPHPSPGDTMMHKNETLYVITVEYAPSARGGYMVRLDLDPKSTRPMFKVPLEAYANLQRGVKKMKRENLGPFITNYAQTGGPGENFAEMFAFYCMNKLPEDQVPLLEAILY